MGQAKNRKLTEPGYGTISNKIRGLVITTPIKINEDGSSSIRSHLDTQDLRSALLYWDRLIWTGSNTLRFKGEANAEYLEHAGVLEKRFYNIDGTIPHIYTTAQKNAMDELERQSPGIWSLGNGENSVLLNSPAIVKNQGTIIQLYNAIPVPSKDVPLSEILTFRQKRRPELLALRAYIESITKEIAISSDSEEALNIRLTEIDKACSDLITVTREWQFPVYLANLNASFNFDLNKAGGNALKAWVATDQLGLDHTTKAVSAGLAGVASIFKVEADIKMRNLNRGSSPFKYAYEIQRELI